MKILGFSGSLRKDAYSKKTLKVVFEHLQKQNVQAEIIDIRELDIPLYEGDLENEIQLPKGIKFLRKKFEEANGVIISTPEYNHATSGVLKNTLDWVSRTEFAPGVTAGKPVAMISSSDGQFGGVRAQISLYPVFNTLGMVMMPAKIYVSNVDKKFNEVGDLTDEKTKQKLEEFAEAFVAFAGKFR